MRVSDNNKVIVDMITCVFDSLICKLVLPLIEKSFFHHISANIAHNSTNKVQTLWQTSSAVYPGNDLDQPTPFR